MNQEKKKLKPFLYINQPQFEAPVGNMQEVYSVKQALISKKQPSISQEQQELEAMNPVENEEEREVKKKIYVEELDGETGIFGAPIKKKDQLPSEEEVQKTIQQYDEVKNSESKKQYRRPSIQRVKSFKEMDILERLDYLHHFPRQLPPVPCQFQTDNKTFRGFVIGKTEDEVELRLLDKTQVTIAIKDLFEVKMIGLNR